MNEQSYHEPRSFAAESLMRLQKFLVGICMLAVSASSWGDEPKPAYPGLRDCVSGEAITWRTIARLSNQSSVLGDRGVDFFQWARDADYKALRAGLARSYHGGSDLTEKNDRGDELIHCVLDPRGHPDVARSPEVDAARLRTVEMLIELGAPVNGANAQNETPLQLAVLNGDEAIVRKLLDVGATLNGNYAPGEHPLQLSVARGDMAITGLLLDQGAIINPQKLEVELGDEPLELATRMANIEMTKFLLQRMVKSDEKPDGALRTLLEPLVENNLPLPNPETRRKDASDRLTIAKMLLKAGADPNYVHEACSGNHTELVKLLLDAGGDPNNISNMYAFRQSRRTPLHEAASHANLEVVNALLAKHAHVATTTNGTRRQAIHYAIMPEVPSSEYPNSWSASDAQRLEVVKVLLKAGADPKALGSDNWTPLHSAVSAGNLEIVKLLLELGADVNAPTYEGLRPLHMDGFPNAVPIAKLLVAKGADVKADHRNLGLHPIHFAASRGDIEMVSYLISKGVPIDSKDRQFHLQPIHHAAESGQVKMVKYLVEHGAKIDAQTFTKKQALHLAAGSGWIKMVRFLLDQGADPNAQDSHGETPVTWARAQDQLSCVTELEKAQLKPDTSPRK